MVRDGTLNADDQFMWVLDPFTDRRSGYYFEIPEHAHFSFERDP
jgi:hypothetical protein